MGKTISLCLPFGFCSLTMDMFSLSSLDARVLESDFLEKFAKFADHSTGLADAKQFAKYLHLPVDHPIAKELFDINDSVYPLKPSSP